LAQAHRPPHQRAIRWVRPGAPREAALIARDIALDVQAGEDLLVEKVLARFTDVLDALPADRRHGAIQRLDRTLKAEGDTPNR
jgi:hypothetical protein